MTDVSALLRPQIDVARIRASYEQVADQLRELIMRGEVAAGDRLPSEAEMSTMFGVGRSTIREALRALASQNLIYTLRGVHGGTFIAEPDAEHINQYLETKLGLLTGSRGLTVDELLESRELLEVPAARLAATRRTPEQVVALRKSLHPDSGARDRGFEVNRHFHEIVLEASGNRLLEVITRPVFGVLRSRFLREAAEHKFWEDVDGHHDLITQAIEDQDPVAAGDLMREHLQQICTTYRDIDLEKLRPPNRPAVAGRD